MKKRLVVLMMSVMVSAVALCGCGSKDESSTRERKQTDPVDTTTTVNDDYGTTTDDDYGITTSDDGDFGTTGDYGTTDDYGTSDEYTLETYYNQPEIYSQYQQVIEQTMQQYQGAYTDMSVEAYGNTMIYSYVIADAYVSQFDANNTKQGLQSYKDTVINQMRTESGITDASITVEYIYYDEAGNILADVELTD